MALNRRERQTLADWFSRPWKAREVVFGTLASRLHRDYGFGEVRGDGRTRARLYISRDDLSALRQELRRDGLGDPCQPTFVGELQSRIQQAQTLADEKIDAQAVTEDLVLCRPLTHWHIDNIATPLPPLMQVGQLLDWPVLQQLGQRLGHTHLVLVENLALMAELNHLKLPQRLNQALFLYRGDVAADRQVSRAYRCFRAFKGRLPLVYFGDFDPAGLEIGLSCGAEQLLLPAQPLWGGLLSADWQGLRGPETRWFEQRAQAQRLYDSPLPDSVEQALLAMDRHKQTRTQEHLLAHDVALELVSI